MLPSDFNSESFSDGTFMSLIPCIYMSLLSSCSLLPLGSLLLMSCDPTMEKSSALYSSWPFESCRLGWSESCSLPSSSMLSRSLIMIRGLKCRFIILLYRFKSPNGCVLGTPVKLKIVILLLLPLRGVLTQICYLLPYSINSLLAPLRFSTTLAFLRLTGVSFISTLESDALSWFYP